MPAYYYQPVGHPRDRRSFQGQPYTSTASFSSQPPRIRRPVPRARSPLSSRAQQRPRGSRPGTAPAPTSATVRVPASRGRGRAEYAQRTARNVFDFAMARYMEQQRRQAGESTRSNTNTNTNSHNTNTHETSHHQSHAGSAVGHAVTGVLLEQLIQEILEYLIRHNFFRRRRNTSAPGGGGGGGGGQQTDQHRQVDTGTQTSQQSSSSSSTDQRRRHRRRRHSEVMMTSLDRLSSELETTYDTLMRVLREPSPAMDDTFRENASDLRRAITRCMARVESVQTRNRRSRRARGSARISRESTSRI